MGLKMDAKFMPLRTEDQTMKFGYLRLSEL